MQRSKIPRPRFQESKGVQRQRFQVKTLDDDAYRTLVMYCYQATLEKFHVSSWLKLWNVTLEDVRKLR